MRVERFVLGTPAPQGSKRPVATKAGLRVVESSKKVAPWREAIVEQFRAPLAGHPPITGPVHVGVTFYLKRPRNHYRANGQLKDWAPVYCVSKPDIDKLLRSTLDGLKTAGAYGDDSQVVAIGGPEKRYVDEEHPVPGAYIAFEPIYWETSK